MQSTIPGSELSERATTGRWAIGDDVTLADLGLPGLFGNHAFAVARWTLWTRAGR